jgi:hypothetical protein
VTKFNPTGSALVYSTYLGGSREDIGAGIAVDAAGNAYLSGRTSSSDFPTTPGAFQTTYGGGPRDPFITKLNPTGSGLVYSTHLRTGGDGVGEGIAVDAGGSAYVTGRASCSLPTTVGAFQPACTSFYSAFVAKMNPAGSALVYATYLSGSGSTAPNEAGFGIGLDAGVDAYITGSTSLANFPTTAGPAFGGVRDGYVAKLNASGSALLYSRFLGGSGIDFGFGIAVDAAGDAAVTGFTASANFPTTTGVFQPGFGGGGSDAFVTKLNPAGVPFYSSYLGGNGDDLGGFLGIAMDTMGNVYVAGETNSTNFPTTSGAFQPNFAGGAGDAFVTKVNPSGTALLYSTYLGGSGSEAVGQSGSIALDDALPNPNAYVAGFTASTDFPTTSGAFQTTYGGGSVDAFVAKIGELGTPATLTLEPAAATNAVGTTHTVTATVRDAGGNPVSNIVVRFSVTGSVIASGYCTTDTSGQCSFTYQGPELPGADAITAFADTNNNGTHDSGEPTGAAEKTWLLPVTTPLCEINVTNGGWIVAANRDTATFGGNAKSDAESNTQGQEEYQDHGPAQPMNVKSISVLAIVCDDVGQEASIYGLATIDGAGSFFYRIKVKDLAEPGVGHDTYWILLDNGYNSGEQTLAGGNVQIRRQ